jgi:hypothetical protein
MTKDGNGLCSENQKLWQAMARQKLWIVDVKHGHTQLGFLEEKEKEDKAHS